MKPGQDGDDRAAGAPLLPRGNLLRWIKTGEADTSRNKTWAEQHRIESNKH